MSNETERSENEKIAKHFLRCLLPWANHGWGDEIPEPFKTNLVNQIKAPLDAKDKLIREAQEKIDGLEKRLKCVTPEEHELRQLRERLELWEEKPIAKRILSLEAELAEARKQINELSGNFGWVSYEHMKRENAAKLTVLQNLRNALNLPLRTVEDFDKLLKSQIPAIDLALSGQPSLKECPECKGEAVVPGKRGFEDCPKCVEPSQGKESA